MSMGKVKIPLLGQEYCIYCSARVAKGEYRSVNIATCVEIFRRHSIWTNLRRNKICLLHAENEIPADIPHKDGTHLDVSSETSTRVSAYLSQELRKIEDESSLPRIRLENLTDCQVRTLTFLSRNDISDLSRRTGVKEENLFQFLFVCRTGISQRIAGAILNVDHLNNKSSNE